MSKFLDQIKQVEAERERKRLKNKPPQPAPVTRAPQENNAALTPDSQTLTQESPTVIAKNAASTNNDTARPEKEQSNITPALTKAPARQAVGFMVGLIGLSLCLAALAAVFYQEHAKLITTAKAYSIAIENLEKDMSRVKTTLLEDEDKTSGIELKVQTLNSEIDKLSQVANGMATQISALESAKDNQQTTIEALLKEKDGFMNKIAALQAGLESLKETNNKKGQ
ncbi:MAG: hypothetical protein A2Y00_03540 [Omnitrophica WOR_2 bacterium GWF2_43_52]|nr:MAG: hypothetical protein A2062_03795 [Omnitrophica WOR_2 bacterium GWA2_44_7]OGX15318.1 MAG: hypothetical protein A2Y01_00125 [Omnitrophica WOR_2 bacterium GWC2_44_8]OGX22506.1 MAG: hypothetical protein A2Y00_03540 [Omnitrophica WOR_2 bacterium GWF2_43_52]HAH21490.1 hypothetical protein [Candidatus Omnitrophota bacterium]HBG64594.1 hypothetical protein [Candidatus Omnitrophota bacterium]